MYCELDFRQIKATGWVKRYLDTQAKGLTGEIGNVGAPFSNPTWEVSNANASGLPQFLGGMNSDNDAWVPFEQNGYWIDGAIRAGHLAQNEKLLTLGRSKIYPAIDNAQPNGFIGPAYLDGGLTWPHAVYFRALMAEYTATGNKQILEALEKHFARRPITDAYKHKDLRIISVRQQQRLNLSCGSTVRPAKRNICKWRRIPTQFSTAYTAMIPRRMPTVKCGMYPCPACWQTERYSAITA